MNFISLFYILFLTAVYWLHWHVPIKHRFLVLLIASCLFYCSQDAASAFLLLCVSLITYLCSLGIARAEGLFWKKCFLCLGLVLPLGILCVFKYADQLAWVIDLPWVRRLFLPMGLVSVQLSYLPFTMGISTKLRQLVLPVGISFYTFQALSYVMDVYRRREQVSTEDTDCQLTRKSPVVGFLQYLLYISFFPQLVAGPIERAQDLMPQLLGKHELTPGDRREGIYLILTGFFKKLVVSDVLGGYADLAFADSSVDNALSVLFAALCFTWQIYMDFSGYTDIARGSARLFHISLHPNFSNPYGAMSVRDFWRRWHMTLTGWFRDYVYKPLGGNRLGRLRTCRNTLIVFSLSGMWHGAGATYLVWGLMHGTSICIELLIDKSRFVQKMPKAVKRFVVFLFIVLAWVMFRADSLGDALRLYGTLLTGWHAGVVGECVSYFSLTVPKCAMLLAAFLCLHRLEKRDGSRGELFSFYMLLALSVAWLALLAGRGENAFIYFQF